jgi:hypothetical protein
VRATHIPHSRVAWKARRTRLAQIDANSSSGPNSAPKCVPKSAARTHRAVLYDAPIVGEEDGVLEFGVRDVPRPLAAPLVVGHGEDVVCSVTGVMGVISVIGVRAGEGVGRAREGVQG